MTTTMQTFRAVLLSGGKTATGIEVPPAVLEALGAGKRPPVRVTIGAHSYRTTIGSMGGKAMIPVSAENRSKAGIAAGDELDVEIALDTEPRVVEVPDDLAAALAADAAVQEAFDRLSNSNKRQYTEWVGSAKKPETRARRVAETVARLSGT